MLKNNKVSIFRIAGLITILVLLLVLAGMVQAEPVESNEAMFSGSFQIPGRLEAEGTYFEIKDSDYLDISLTSSVPIKLVLKSVPEKVTLYFESISESTSSQITIRGFAPRTTYHKYEDNYHEHTSFTTDAQGTYEYTQDLSIPHLVFIQSRASTLFINDSSTGGDCNLIGTWTPSTKTCTLSADLTGTIQVDSDGIILDGNDRTITGDNTGSGVYLSGRRGVSIKYLNIRNFSEGIFNYNSSNNNISRNYISYNWNGIFLFSSNNNTLNGNTALNNVEGMILAGSGNNTLTNNMISGSTYNFELYGGENLHFDNQIDISNLVNDRPVFYIIGAVDTVYDSLTSAGTFYCIDCVNVTIKDMNLDTNGAGIFLWNTTSSSIQNIITSKNINGIFLGSSSNNNTLGGNFATNNWNGLVLEKNSNNTLSENTAFSNDNYGILLRDNSHNNTLKSNTASNNAYGIVLRFNSYDNTLSSNTASGNNYGIYLGNSFNNTLKSSIILSNDHGIYVAFSNYNIIYDNYLSNPNNTNKFLFTSNKWNISKTPGINVIGGPYQGGNVWLSQDGNGFSQTCTDADSDGICDTPLPLDNNNIDSLPLKYTEPPTPIPEFPLSIALPITSILGIVLLLFMNRKD